MPIPTPNLDDRRFQQIVDEAKRLIPRYCPEWTDHNVSDPGVAMIELFAWMTDMLLYRVNQIPDKMYLTFLDLIGFTLEEARSAVAPVTFYLREPLAGSPTPDERTPEVVISAGTEVATVRTEHRPATTFTTEADLVIRKPGKYVVMAHRSRHSGTADDHQEWIKHDLTSLRQSGTGAMPIFPPPLPNSDRLASEDALYIGLEHDPSYHVLELELNCKQAGGTGVNPDDPPIVWEMRHQYGWAPCAWEDTTGGFSQNGIIKIYLPNISMKDARCTYADHMGYWVRCRLTEKQEQSESFYSVSPVLTQLQIRALGGTMHARHAIAIHKELLGRSNGQPGQTFKLLYPPILKRDPQRDYLEVELDPNEWEYWSDSLQLLPKDAQIEQDRYFLLKDGQLHEVPNFAYDLHGKERKVGDFVQAGLHERRFIYDRDGSLWEAWQEVLSFADSRRDSRHFTLDRDGNLMLGRLLPQPDGTVYCYGAVPETGRRLRFSRYRQGGGASGNVAAEALTVMKTANPYVAHVVNHKPASGGADEESIDRARLRASSEIRTRDRAVTIADYEYLASQIQGVSRVRCIAPTEQSSGRTNPPPGTVRVKILPEIATQHERIRPVDLELNAQLKAKVQQHLDERKMLGTFVEISELKGVWVSVEVQVHIPSRSNLRSDDMRQRIEAELYRYLSPHRGGLHGQGWSFGQDLYVSEIYMFLQRVLYEGFVADVKLFISSADGNRQETRHVSVPPDEVICSDRHRVRVVIRDT
jgi:hypothetical protein